MTMYPTVPADASADYLDVRPSERVLVLRAELWRRHASLQTIDPSDARHAAATDELLDLTAEFLAAEVREVEYRRASDRGRRVRKIAALIAVGLLVTVILFGLTYELTGGWTSILSN